MQITIKEIIAPQPPNEEKGWKGTKNYKIVTTDGKKGGNLEGKPHKNKQGKEYEVEINVSTSDTSLLYFIPFSLYMFKT